MKMHITMEDLASLDESRRRILSDMWRPEKYDLAAARICMDAENEKYDEFEFVVGNVTADKYGHIYVHDINAVTETEALPDDESIDGEPPAGEKNIESYLTYNYEGSVNPDEVMDSLKAPISDEEKQESSEEEYYGEEFDCSYSRPGFFNREDCVPLVNIGQMVDILQRCNFGNNDLYIYVSTGIIKCELGRDSTDWDAYNRDYENSELCDVLWESVKAVLG